MFIKPPTTALCGPGKVQIPDGCEQFDWEVELAVIIGKRMCKVSRAQAMAGIAGYSVSVDGGVCTENSILIDYVTEIA